MKTGKYRGVDWNVYWQGSNWIVSTWIDTMGVWMTDALPYWIKTRKEAIKMVRQRINERHGD